METNNGRTVISQTVNKKPEKPERDRDVNGKLFIVILVLILIIVLGALGFVVYALIGFDSKTDIDLVGNIDVSDLGLEGYDGEGILNYDEKYLATLVEYSGTSSKVRDFISGVSYTVTPDTDISNGDTVTIKAEYDKRAARHAGVKVIKDTKKLTVEQLDEKDEDGYNYGSADNGTESTDTFDDPEDDYPEGSSGRDYTDNDMYVGGGVEYETKTANGKDGYINVREKRSTKSDVIINISNGTRVDVYDLEDDWYTIATGPYKGYYIHRSALVD